MTTRLQAISPRRSTFCALAAYLGWGAFPLYFKQLQLVPAAEIVAHRAFWSLIFLLLVMTLRQQWAWLSQALRTPKVLVGFCASALALTANWLIFIWAVNHDRVVDASLGYFINPLVNVLFGALLLHEQLRRIQFVAILIAALGVAWLTWQAGHLPWIGLLLGISFSTYGLLRKTASLGALEGLTLETMLMFVPAAAYFIYLAAHGQNAFLHAGIATRSWLVAAGPITAVPLLLFATGARGISFVTLGVLQYITPSLQLWIGAGVYQEPFGPARALGFAAIWLALAIYAVESIWRHRAMERTH
ncbi:MAG: EamA family transporter RarD [Gammaproteobacteria bacterium]